MDWLWFTIGVLFYILCCLLVHRNAQQTGVDNNGKKKL